LDGRLFHNRGPAAGNAHLYIWLWFEFKVHYWLECKMDWDIPLPSYKYEAWETSPSGDRERAKIASKRRSRNNDKLSAWSCVSCKDYTLLNTKCNPDRITNTLFLDRYLLLAVLVFPVWCDAPEEVGFGTFLTLKSGCQRERVLVNYLQLGLKKRCGIH